MPELSVTVQPLTGDDFDPALRAALRVLSSESSAPEQGWIRPRRGQVALQAGLDAGTWRVAGIVRRLARDGYIEYRLRPFHQGGTPDYRLTRAGYACIGESMPRWRPTQA